MVLLALLALVVGGGPAYGAVRHSSKAHTARTHLARNSVGAAQIRRSAVGSSEIRNGSIVSADISKRTLAKLHGAVGAPGPQGPAGPAGAPAPSYFAVVSGSGDFLRGNATSGGHTASGSGSYTIGFGRNVSSCAYSVTLGGIDATTQPPGFATVRDDGGKVGVQLYDTAGNPVDRSFHLVVAC